MNPYDTEYDAEARRLRQDKAAEVARQRNDAKRDLEPPYPFCRTPRLCAGKGYCPKDPACNN